jgi:hypothetical protein
MEKSSRMFARNVFEMLQREFLAVVERFCVLYMLKHNCIARRHCCQFGLIVIEQYSRQATVPLARVLLSS